MSARRLVDAAALRALCEAAAAPHPDTYELRAALSALAAAESTAPTRPWMSVTEAARLLGVCERTIRNHARDGQLPHRRVGRRLLIAASAVHGTGRNRAEPESATGSPAPDDDPTDPEDPTP